MLVIGHYIYYTFIINCGLRSYSVASPARKNWGLQKQIFSPTLFRLLENSISISILKFLDKQLSQAVFFVTVAFLPVRKSKSI